MVSKVGVFFSSLLGEKWSNLTNILRWLENPPTWKEMSQVFKSELNMVLTNDIVCCGLSLLTWDVASVACETLQPRSQSLRFFHPVWICWTKRCNTFCSGMFLNLNGVVISLCPTTNAVELLVPWYAIDEKFGHDPLGIIHKCPVFCSMLCLD